jgi:hypothetical protein
MGTNFTDFATTDPVNAATFNDRFDELDVALQARLRADGSVDSTGEQDFAGGIKTDDIAESTLGEGVTVDGVLLKDSDVYADAAEAAGLEFNIRTNLFEDGGELLGHFRGALPSGFSWTGSPFATPTVTYSAGSYANISASTSGAFLQKSASGAVYVTARVAQFNALTEVGVRADDGTDDNYAELLMVSDASGVAQLVVRTRASGGTPAEVSFDYGIAANQFLTIALNHRDTSGLVARSFLVNEFGVGFYFAGVTSSFTVARAGLVARSLIATRAMYVDWMQGDF